MFPLSAAAAEQALRTSMALHDINNLLMVMTGNLEMIPLEPLPVSTQAQLITIRKAVDSAASLAHGALRPQDSKRDQPTDVVQTVRECLHLVSIHLDPSVQINALFECDAAIVSIEAARLRLVVLNLVMNAANACDKAVCRINITLRMDSASNMDQAWLLLEIEDDGPGIPADLIEQVFSPFVTRDRAGNGLGLGLTSVWHTVKAAAGEIDVVSEENRGTRFTIRLPALLG